MTPAYPTSSCSSSRAEAKVVIEQWRLHYNAERPHSSLGYLASLMIK